jgi:hypothetical protein
MKDSTQGRLLLAIVCVAVAMAILYHSVHSGEYAHKREPHVISFIAEHPHFVAALVAAAGFAFGRAWIWVALGVGIEFVLWGMALLVGC